MVSKSRSEKISSRKTGKNLEKILDNLKKGDLERAIISKNNELEAVILPIQIYEEIMEMAEILEHLQIAKLIKDRENEQPGLSFDEVLKKSGIIRDEI